MCGETKSLAANALSAQNFKRSVVIVLCTFGESGVVCDEVVAAKELNTVSLVAAVDRRAFSPLNKRWRPFKDKRYCKTRSDLKNLNGKCHGTLKGLPKLKPKRRLATPTCSSTELSRAMHGNMRPHAGQSQSAEMHCYALPRLAVQEA
jgi:hypothetical protein